MIIDPPSPFAPTKEWREFLFELEKIRDPDNDVKRHIEIAKAEIKARQSRSA